MCPNRRVSIRRFSFDFDKAEIRDRCFSDIQALKDVRHACDNIINKRIVLNRLQGGYYRTVEGLGYDIVSLLSHLTDEEDKSRLSLLFDYLADEQAQINAIFDISE